MHIEFLVEEPSTEEALHNLLPRILRPETSYQMHTFQGKKNMIEQLPRRLRGYARWLPPDWRIVVLLDEDRQDCLSLKALLEDAVRQAGLYSKASPSLNGQFQVINRVAIEELEAWFFGDVEAICQAYPSVSKTLARQARYRNPDAILGGTWEALERVLQRAGYYQSGLAKTQVAREISIHMQPSRNRSKSFQVFLSGLLALTS